jgi:hypothetical protein
MQRGFQSQGVGVGVSVETYVVCVRVGVAVDIWGGVLHQRACCETAVGWSPAVSGTFGFLHSRLHGSNTLAHGEHDVAVTSCRVDVCCNFVKLSHHVMMMTLMLSDAFAYHMLHFATREGGARQFIHRPRLLLKHMVELLPAQWICCSGVLCWCLHTQAVSMAMATA